MGERLLLSLTPSDRALEQAIVALKKGAYILKYGRRGKPKLCPFRLSTDERTLMWFSGKEEKQLQLNSVTKIIHGHGTRKLQPERESHSFSLIFMKNQAHCSLDLICKDKIQADSWFIGLKALISRSQDYGHLENVSGAQSCINSPTSFIRRKYNLEFPKETTRISQVRSICGSPIPSLSDRCFSDGISFSSDSFYSQSSLSIMHNSTDGLVSSSPCVKHEKAKKMSKMVSRFVAPAVSPKLKQTKLSDVLVWGEGVENGVLAGGGVDVNRTQVDTLLPKVVDSVSMLDVEKISLAGKHGVLVSKQGEVFCWGEGKTSRVGHKGNPPKEIETLNGVHVISASCSEYQTCALTVSGEVYTWGEGWLPRRISGILDGICISKVACGEWHTAIVSTSGQLYTFGDGTFGVLGHGNCQSLSEPKQVESLKGMRVKSVACGTWHTAAVVGLSKSGTPSGKLFTWGNCDKGKLGHDHSYLPETKDKPTCIMQLVNHEFVQVSCGRMLTVGLTTTGVVYTMGSSVHGQLGNPHARENSITLVQGRLKLEFVRDIATGSNHVAVFTSKGSVYTWGKGSNGQLGVGDTEDRSSPTLVEALRHRHIQSISCGPSSTAAVCVHKSITCERSACCGCNTEFGFIKKKHNCYNCGLLFCSICSSNKTKNAGLAPDETKSFRVCDSCYKGLSGQILRIQDLNPRPLLIKTFSDETGHKNPRGSGSGLVLDTESGSLLMNGAPRWGQVSSPASFRKHCKEEFLLNNVNVDSHVSVRVNQNQQNPCQPSVGKRKGAKDAIKALTSRLQLMSPRAFMRKQAKVRVDTPTTSANHLTSSAAYASCSVDARDVNSLCNSTLVPTTHNNACINVGNTSPSDEAVAEEQNKVKQKHEWMEQYKPGVYITFIMLPNGQKGIKRVRFSRKVFREREAEKWWVDNQQQVYDNYNVDGYINSF